MFKTPKMQQNKTK